MKKIEIPCEVLEIEETHVLMNCILCSDRDKYCNEVRSFTRELFPDDIQENDRYTITISTEVGRMICEAEKFQHPDSIFKRTDFFKDFDNSLFFKEG